MVLSQIRTLLDSFVYTTYVSLVGHQARANLAPLVCTIVETLFDPFVCTAIYVLSYARLASASTLDASRSHFSALEPT